MRTCELEVFSHIGTRLPLDFVQFYKRYGEGYFYSISHPRSANLSVYAGRYGGPVTSHSFSFRKCVPDRLTELRLQKERRPKTCPSRCTGNPGGLLPWGRTSNDTDLCWKVQGDLVDNWTVVVFRPAPEATKVILRRLNDRISKRDHRRFDTMQPLTEGVPRREGDCVGGVALRHDGRNVI